MSRNTLRAFYEAFNRRDYDVALQFADVEVELHPGIEGLDTNR
jgi:hypothetical protein